MTISSTMSPTMSAVKQSPTRPGGPRRRRRQRGRPRSKELDASILEATLELASEVGINGMSMDELAQRAGVSKASIYRRWPSKELLVIDALRSAMGPLDAVDTGDVGSDLRAILGDLVSRFSSKERMNDVLPHLIEVATHDPTLRVELDAYTQLRRVPMRASLERGVDPWRGLTRRRPRHDDRCVAGPDHLSPAADRRHDRHGVHRASDGPRSARSVNSSAGKNSSTASSSSVTSSGVPNVVSVVKNDSCDVAGGERRTARGSVVRRAGGRATRRTMRATFG